MLGQVAAGGGNFGGMLAEGLGGMFGLTTAEERKALEVQNIMKTITASDDPNAYAVGAKKLNDMGFIPEALQLLQVRSSLLSDKLTSERIDSSKAGQWQMVTKPTGNRKPNGEMEYVSYEINSRTGEKRNEARYFSPFPPKTDWMSQLMAAQGAGGAGGNGFEVTRNEPTLEAITKDLDGDGEPDAQPAGADSVTVGGFKLSTAQLVSFQQMYQQHKLQNPNSQLSFEEFIKRATPVGIDRKAEEEARAAYERYNASVFLHNQKTGNTVRPLSYEEWKKRNAD